MFHNQTTLFVSFLCEKDSTAFRKLILDILNEQVFAVSVSKHYGKNIKKLWQEFVDDLLGY